VEKMSAKKMVLAEEEFVRPALGAEPTTAAELLASFEEEGASIEVEQVSAIYGHGYPTMVEIRVERDYYGTHVARYLTDMTPAGAARRFGLDSYYDTLEARVYPVRVGV
jgi:hypothetical protein